MSFSAPPPQCLLILPPVWRLPTQATPPSLSAGPLGLMATLTCPVLSSAMRWTSTLRMVPGPRPSPWGHLLPSGLYPYSNYTIHVRLTNALGLASNPINITSTTISFSESLLLINYFNPSTTTGPGAPTITSLVADSSTQMTIMWAVSM